MSPKVQERRVELGRSVHCGVDRVPELMHVHVPLFVVPLQVWASGYDYTAPSGLLGGDTGESKQVYPVTFDHFCDPLVVKFAPVVDY